MVSVLKSAASQVKGLGGHVAKQIAKQPGEILKNALGQGGEERQDLRALEQGGGQQGQGGDDSQALLDPQKLKRYEELSSKRDEIELARLRKQLHQEYGLPVSLERGMQEARLMREKRKEEEKQIEEKEAEQKKLLLEEKKRKESKQVLMAKAQASAERGIGRRIAG